MPRLLRVRRPEWFVERQLSHIKVQTDANTVSLANLTELKFCLNVSLMVTKEYSSLGLTIPFQVPGTVEEFNENAKRPSACLDEAVNNIVYRNSLAEFRDVFLHGRKEVKGQDGQVKVTEIKGVEQLSGVERLTETKELKEKEADGLVKTVDVFTESEAVYFKRVCGILAKQQERSIDDVVKGYQSLANTVAASIDFDASASERKPAGPKKLPKAYLEVAQRAITAGKADKLAGLLADSLGRQVGLTVEELAVAMQEDEAMEKEKRRAKLLGSLG